MKLNRELQRKILSVLTECFPKDPPPNFLHTLRAEYGEDETDGNPEEQAKDSYTEDGITYSIAITPGLPVMFSLSLDE